MRVAVATLLGQLTKQPLHGPRISLLLGRLLPPGLVAAIEVRMLHPPLRAHRCHLLSAVGGPQLLKDKCGHATRQCTPCHQAILLQAGLLMALACTTP